MAGMLLLAVTAVLCGAYDVSGLTCKPNLTIAHPRNCSSFYLCDHKNVPHPFTCPEGLLFNPKKKQCDWPTNVDCALKNGKGQAKKIKNVGKTGRKIRSASEKPEIRIFINKKQYAISFDDIKHVTDGEKIYNSSFPESKNKLTIDSQKGNYTEKDIKTNKVNSTSKVVHSEKNSPSNSSLLVKNASKIEFVKGNYTDRDVKSNKENSSIKVIHSIEDSPSSSSLPGKNASKIESQKTKYTDRDVKMNNTNVTLKGINSKEDSPSSSLLGHAIDEPEEETDKKEKRGAVDTTSKKEVKGSNEHKQTNSTNPLSTQEKEKLLTVTDKNKKEISNFTYKKIQYNTTVTPISKEVKGLKLKPIKSVKQTVKESDLFGSKDDEKITNISNNSKVEPLTNKSSSVNQSEVITDVYEYPVEFYGTGPWSRGYSFWYDEKEENVTSSDNSTSQVNVTEVKFTKTTLNPTNVTRLEKKSAKPEQSKSNKPTEVKIPSSIVGKPRNATRTNTTTAAPTPAKKDIKEAVKLERKKIPA